MELLVASLGGIVGGFTVVVSVSVGSFTLLQRLGEWHARGYRLVPVRASVRRPYPYR